jgi:hypothetical protein
MNRISFNNYIYISPKSALYNYNPDNKYHKKLLEKTGDRPIVVVTYNPCDEISVLKYSSNNYGVYLMQQRYKLTGAAITDLATTIPNITISKKGDNYILRGNPDKELLSKIKELKYKLPNNKTIKTLKRRIVSKHDFVIDSFGWVIQSESDIEGLCDYLPDIEKNRLKLTKTMKQIIIKLVNDALLFTNIRNGESISPADLLFTVKDFYNNPSLLEIKSKDIAPDFKNIVKETNKKVDESSVRLLYNIVFNMIDSDSCNDPNLIDEFIRLYGIFKQRYPQLSEIKIVIFIIELYMKDKLKDIKNEYKNRIEKSKKIVSSEKAIEAEKVIEVNEEKNIIESEESSDSSSSSSSSESSEDSSSESEESERKEYTESDKDEPVSETKTVVEKIPEIKTVEVKTVIPETETKIDSNEKVERIKNIFDDIILDTSTIENVLNTGIGERSAILVLSAFKFQ